MAEPQGALGEVLKIARRVHTPAYTSELRKGDAIDSGIIAILDSNLSHLSREFLHHLGTAIGGDAPLEQNSFANLEDLDEPANAASLVDSIAWTRAVAFCWGPFDLTADRPESAALRPRAVSVSVDAIGGTASSLRLIVALAQGEAVPRSETVLAWGAQYVNSGRGVTTLTVKAPTWTQGQQRARADGSAYAAWSDLRVWLGWQSTSGTDRVIAADVWESR